MQGIVQTAIPPNLEKYTPEYRLDQFREERTPENLERLRLATINYCPAYPGQERAFTIDSRRWFNTVSNLLALGRTDIEHYLEMWPMLFLNPRGKRLCGYLRSRCDWPHEETSKNRCKHKYTNVEEAVCPLCGAVRWLCRQPAQANGRCNKHGARVPYGRTNGRTRDLPADRASLIAAAINSPRTRDTFLAIMRDPDPLSVLPQIGTLTTRYIEVISQMDKLDPEAIERAVRDNIQAIIRAGQEEDYREVVSLGLDLMNLIDVGKDNRGRWRELTDLSAHIARLAEVERKNLTERQQMITFQEMAALQQQTIEMVQNAIRLAAGWIYAELTNEHSRQALTAEVVRVRMSSALSTVMREKDQDTMRQVAARVIDGDDQPV